MIYFDNAATSYPKPPSVGTAVAQAIEDFGNPSRGAHDFSLAADRCVEYTRERIAELFNCPDPGRVAFCKNVTEALNIAINSVSGHIISSEAEHNSVLRPLFRRGNYSLVETDELGRYRPEDIVRAIRPDSTAVVLAHASNLTGNLAPVEELGRLCREKGLYFILDTAQTAGLFPLDMQALGVDALCFTGHKSLYGLQGTGGLCLSSRFSPRPLIVGGSGSRSFEMEQPAELPELLEAGTLNSHGLAGLAAGLDYLREQGSTPLEQADALARFFYDSLKDLRGLIFYGDYLAERRAPIVTLNIEDMPSEELAALLLDEQGICVRAGAHCAPLLHRRFGTETLGAVRFSFSHFNTRDEVQTAVNCLRNCAPSRQRSQSGVRLELSGDDLDY